MSIAPERAQPRSTYVHLDGCRAVSRVALNVAQQIADDLESLDDLYCTGCRERRPILEFYWVDPDGQAYERQKIKQEKE
jgi:hypothetical protein